MMGVYSSSGLLPTEVDPAKVVPAFRLPIAGGDRLELSWISPRSSVPQGLGVRVRMPNTIVEERPAGLVQVNRTVAPAVMLWRDTAPPSFTIVCLEAMRGAELQVANRWRPPGRQGDFWSSCFGMVVESVGDGVWVVRCSDESGRFDRDNLVVQLRSLSGQESRVAA